ncbi:MAG: type II secretion system F family protein [Planctomycetota bacterium]
MASLSDLQVAALLEEIAASMRAGIPLSSAMDRLQAQRLGRVSRAARRIHDRLERGASVPESIQPVLPMQLKGVAKAIEVAAQENDPQLLSRTAKLLFQRAESRRDGRFSWAYPIALLFLGLLVGGAVMAPLVLSSQGRDLRWSEPVVQCAQWLTSQSIWNVPGWPEPESDVARWFTCNGMLSLAALAVLVIFVWVLITRRRKFSPQTRLELFCRSLADQFSHNVPESEAIQAAAEIADEKDLAAMETADLSTPRVKAILNPSFAKPIANLSMDQQQWLIAKLNYLAHEYRERARRRTLWLTRLLPRIAMVVVGCGMVFGYTWWVIRPVYTEIATW